MQAFNSPTAITMPCAFAVVPFAKVQRQTYIFLIEAPITREKSSVPIQAWFQGK